MRKYILLLSLLAISIFSYGQEIIPEDFLLEKAIPFLETAPKYRTNDSKNNLTDVKAMKVPKALLKVLKSDTPFSFFDSNNEIVEIKENDFLVSPTTYSRIYVVPRKEFLENYSK